MDFKRLQQFHFTVYSIMNMITAFSILLQLHGVLLILVLLILDFTYLVVLVVAILKSNLERIRKMRMRFKEKSIPPCRAGPPAHVHMTIFHFTWVAYPQNQVRTGWLTSHMNTLSFLKEFFKKGEISPR